MGLAGSFVFFSVWYSFLTSFLILTQTALAFSFPLVSPTGHHLTPLSNTTPAQAFRSPLFKKMWSSNVKCKECKKMDRKGNWFIKYCNFAYLHSIKNNILLTYGHLTRTSNLEFNTSFCSVLLMFNTLFRTIFIQISNIWESRAGICWIIFFFFKIMYMVCHIIKLFCILNYVTKLNWDDHFPYT